MEQEKGLPEGEDARRSVDWMDFESPDGGDERSMVHLGVRKVSSKDPSTDRRDG